MPQKPNHSNDGELQPTNADGTYAPKSGGEGSFESDEKETKQALHGDNPKLSAPKSDASVSASKSPSLGFNWKNNPQILEKMKAYAQKKMEEKQIVLDEEAKKQIEEAEKALGSEGFYDTYKGIYELDPQLVAKATPEEMEALREAILKSEEIIDLTKSHQDYLDNLEKQIQETDSDVYLSWYGFYIQPKLSNIWKGKDTVLPEDYEELKDSIPSKIEYFQNEIDSGNATPAKVEGYKGKIDALNNFVKWGEGAKESIAKKKELEQKLKEAKENSPEDPKALDQYQKVIEKYQNPNAVYSIVRKNKAIWCQNYEQALKTFSKEAEQQRLSMTPEEIDALAGYTGSGSSTINKPLYGIKYSSGYGDKKFAKSKAMKSIKLLTSALDKSKSTRDIWLQRGVDDLPIGNIKVTSATSDSELNKLIGSEFIHPSVMSCGAAKGTGFEDSPIIMNVYCPKGTKMNYIDKISHFEGHENEMLVARGYHYIVKKVSKSKGRIYIDFDLQIGSDADRLTDEELAKKYEENLK